MPVSKIAWEYSIFPHSSFPCHFTNKMKIPPNRAPIMLFVLCRVN